MERCIITKVACDHNYDCDFCPHNKEKEMKETVEFKIKDVKKAYDNGCDDVKKVLKDMAPGLFEEEWRELGCDDIELEWCSYGTRAFFLRDKKTQGIIGHITKLEPFEGSSILEPKIEHNDCGISKKSVRKRIAGLNSRSSF